MGARTFALAPIFEKFFTPFAQNVYVSGVEIDAYRRFTDLRTRQDYGNYYARQVKFGQYFAQDFLKWHGKADVIMLLNPFVTPEPHSRWGLPLRAFKPAQLFSHSFSLLNKGSGLLLLSSPTEEEFEIAKFLAEENKFKCVEEQKWIPTVNTLQKQPRLGALFTT